MQKRYVYAGIGVLVLAAALALPAIARPGLRGRAGWGMGGWGMMGGPGVAQTISPVTSIDAAAARAREALAATGADLAVEEVMEFSNHFYVLVKEKSTGVGALELIVERNGLVHPEPGPNMMWNTKYGHMAGFGGYGMMGGGMMGGGAWGGGMMGGWGPRRGLSAQPVTPSAQSITKDRAKQSASQYLIQAFPGATPDEGTAFYGYFTFDVERAGKTFGMLSVNAYTGSVWYHTWHGTFVQEKHF